MDVMNDCIEHAEHSVIGVAEASSLRAVCPQLCVHSSID